MDLIFLLICYVSTLLTTVNSYVLLAANLDDFRSIAKKFVPDKLADQIVEVVSGTGKKYRDLSSYHKHDETAEFLEPDSRHDRLDRHERQHRQDSQEREEREDRQERQEILERPERQQREERHEKIERSYEMTIDSYNPHQVPHHTPQVPRYEMKSVSGLSLDEIVEKVKQKLQSELFNRDVDQQAAVHGQPAAYSPLRLAGNNDKEPSAEYDATPMPTNTAHKIRYIKQSRLVRKPQPVQISNPNVHQEPRLQQSGIQPQKQQLNRHLKKQKIVRNKQLVRVTPQKALQTPSNTQEEEITVPGVEYVDMLKSNDSYEDYVTPPKEEVFESEVVAETKAYASVTPRLKRRHTKTKPTEPTIADVDVEMAEEIDTNDGQVANGAAEYDNDATETTTETKAKTENISYEEKESRPEPNASILAEKVVKGGTTKKPKMGTMIPTRETYKMSSPNYYAKLPTIAEKYNFDEPIPERDREPENLKPIGQPPASINGKVVLL